ncbi:macrolide family glycosyltransferase [Streptomyces sp. NBC_01500]|uniref:macrolide family glycosyltransferase n=1 Tax=Streptomyces sp. NBC_01500 TaxID=2903886 RepID=UPI00225A60A6|nr:macrolide family glycosyltransferase [Streptomyces sp. NBC_01500]MCX4547593.1 MGT family glycosyltransferase [Streptomyces sp. NBC_01500]
MTGPRRHLAFLPYPAYGHMMPVLPVVAELVARGHRVTCFATEDFEERVRATGAEVRPYDPPLSSDPPPENIDADECARAPLKLLDASTAVLPTIESCFSGGPPDAVVYDTTLWLTGRLLAARWQRPSIQLSPTFISNEHFDLSAQHQEYAGRVDPAHPAIVEFAVRLTETVGSSGLRDEQKAELFYGRREFTLAFLPREFQFAGATFDERHAFVGPTCDGRQEDGWQPPASGAPVLLVSLGTTVNNRPDFFRHCAKAFADLPWHVVLALGDRVAPGELGELPPNVEAHRWVPMGAVLAHASVFLCQSGMGSIMESLYAGVPMVVVPHHPEQHVNARRLTELGLAEVVQRDEVSPEALRDAVARVAGDSGMRERVRDMRQHVRAAGGARRAADVIEERLRTASLEVR